MDVLITGGSGYIGTHIAVCLLQRGDNVIVADDLSNSCVEALRRVERITGRTVRFYRADVCDRAALEPVFAENHIDALIHCAGMKAVGESVQKPLQYYRNNLNATLTLLDAMWDHQVKRIIFSSSATVYDIEREQVLTEQSPLGNCSNPYSWTKFFSEQMLCDAAKAAPSLSVVLLRYFNPIGAHESGMIGEDPNGIPNNLMPYISQVAVGRLPELRVFGNDYPTPDGTCIRDYIHVMDLAEGHMAALDYICKGAVLDSFNLGSGKGSSVMEVVNTFMRANDRAIPYQYAARRAGDLPMFYSDPAKAGRILHWETRRTLEDMCRDSWNWQSQNPNGYHS